MQQLQHRPLIMGIINVTPDSFHTASRIYYNESTCAMAEWKAAVADRARAIVHAGGVIVDVGACSTRPGAEAIDAAEEIRRLRVALPVVRAAVPGAVLSVDTYRADVARMAVEELGADMVNDIGGGTLDDAMLPTVARLGVPYVLTHMRGTPATMQALTDYTAEGDVFSAVCHALCRGVERLLDLGAERRNIIVDPGYGFAKTLEQNYALLARQAELKRAVGCALLVGVSRKSMVTRLLGIDASEALNATTVLHTLALMQGADILRVHDVREAVEAVRIVRALNDATITS